MKYKFVSFHYVTKFNAPITLFRCNGKYKEYNHSIGGKAFSAGINSVHEYFTNDYGYMRYTSRGIR